MIITIKGEDTRERYWMPNKVLQTILAELLEDFVGIKIIEFNVERGKGDEPESKDEDWA